MGIFFERLFDFIINDLGDNLLFWRIFALSLLVFIVTIITFKNKIITYYKKESIMASDKSTFTESDEIMSEDNIKSYIDTLGIDRVINWQSRKVSDFVDYFKKTGNQYSNSDLRKLCRNLVDELYNLQIFVATHFFWYPNNQQTEDTDNIQSKLYPELAHEPPDSSGYKTYILRRKELHQALDKVELLYKQYRQRIRKKLLL